jgi:phospholipase A-2-activating protein
MTTGESDQMFHLHRMLVGHTQDVRTLATSPSGAVVSGSRDASIRVWAQDQGSDTESDGASMVVQGHGDYVTALVLSPVDDTIVSGSRDNTIRLWSKSSPGAYALATVLSGHEYQVTGVAILDDVRAASKARLLASTSLDGSVRLWKVGEGVTTASTSDAELREHEGPVLCCCGFGGNTGERWLATGSGDCTIRLWRISTDVDGVSGAGVMAAPTAVFRGHTDTVRSVAYIPSLSMLVSGSHDTFVKVWTLDGNCLQTMEGHGALVFSVAASPDGTMVASGSEDNTVRVWGLDGTCKQVIRHPGCVWAVEFLPNGDLATGCADGTVRVWSMDGERAADADLVAAYEASLAEKDLAGQGGSTIQADGANASGGAPKMKMHDPSVLRDPGEHDGQTIVVNEGSFGMVYSWNQQASDWERVGEVMMDGADSWDFNFDVDIADDRPKLKLQANAGEDAYEVADRFIAAHALPASYREQITQFLITNTNGAVNINLDTSGAYVDPLTGGGAYIPGSGTGGAGWQSSAQVAPPTNVDPFTGSSMVSSGLLPIKGYTLFSSPLVSDNVLAKLRELNPPSTLESSISSEDEWAQVRALTHDARDPYSPAIQKIMGSWPREAIFPVLDAYRAMLTMAPGRAALMDAVRTIGPSPPAGSLGAVLESVFAGDQPASTPTRIVALRLLANLFDVDLIPVIGPRLDDLLDLVKGTVDHVGTKGIAIAFTTFLMNTAVYLQKVPRASVSTSRALAGLAGAVVERSDAVVASSVTNALLVIGTLRRESLIKPSDISHVAGAIKRLASAGGDCQLVASEVASML